jgi:hypothetical protein
MAIAPNGCRGKPGWGRSLHTSWVLGCQQRGRSLLTGAGVEPLAAGEAPTPLGF